MSWLVIGAGGADTDGMPLLERESSLTSLAGYAEEARRGEGRLVLVAGEAGVGKSALAERLERDLPDARWCWGACDGLFTPRPLGPLFDFAGQLGGELLKLRRAGAARQELFAALLGQVSEPGTLDVLVVEDIHWADEATVDMLCFLGRRIKNASVLLIATYREEDLAAGDLLRAALGELARQRCTRRRRSCPVIGISTRGSAPNISWMRARAASPWAGSSVPRSTGRSAPCSWGASAAT